MLLECDHPLRDLLRAWSLCVLCVHVFPLVYHSDQGHKRLFLALLLLSILNGNIRPSVFLSLCVNVFLDKGRGGSRTLYHCF